MMTLINFQDITLSYGTHTLLNQVNFTVEKNERICLIGRNGAGKSTLLKLVEGLIKPDSGKIIYDKDIKIYALQQEVPHDISGTVFEVVLSGLGVLSKLVLDYEVLANKTNLDEKDIKKMANLQEKIENANAWSIQNKAHDVISRLELDGKLDFSQLSGGLKRRVLLAKALVCAPDLLLLDEPTNHLDIESIQWLEEFLPEYKGSILFISHDRDFLQKITTRILELDRGNLINFKGSYQNFLKHKENELHAEAQQNALFDKKLQQEEVWIRQGIKARRTRNEGRVRALEQMRRERQQRRTLEGKAKITVSNAERSGKSVLVAENIGFNFEDKWLFKDFSIEIFRGDKIGILGPNGCGKSTLLNVLLQKLIPSEGQVKLGSNLQIAYFDQLRNQLNESLSIQDNVADGSEFVEINGNKRHILSYLGDFLFTPERARTPVSALSGGERNRALLAKALSKPSNLLILDEPTNDLDIETLEVLEEILVNYKGTILLVSHDRAFINNVVTSTIVFEGGAKLEDYIGGYDDWLRQKKNQNEKKQAESKIKKESRKPDHIDGNKSKKLTYAEKIRLEKLPQEIEHLENQISTMTEEISSPEFYQKDQQVIKNTQQKLQILEAKLEETYNLWEKLESLKE